MWRIITYIDAAILIKYLGKSIIVIDGEDERLAHDVSIWDLKLERLVEYRVKGFAVHLRFLQMMPRTNFEVTQSLCAHRHTRTCFRFLSGRR